MTIRHHFDYWRVYRHISTHAEKVRRLLGWSGLAWAVGPPNLGLWQTGAAADRSPGNHSGRAIQVWSSNSQVNFFWYMFDFLEPHYDFLSHNLTSSKAQLSKYIYIIYKSVVNIYFFPICQTSSFWAGFSRVDQLPTNSTHKSHFEIFNWNKGRVFQYFLSFLLLSSLVVWWYRIDKH